MGLAELVKTGQVTSRGLVEVAIAIIEAQNPRLNAVIHKMYDRALAASITYPKDQPFSGVPFLLKDMLDLENTASSLGAFLGTDNIGRDTHELAQRIEGAGLITLGRTNMSELGLLPTTEPEAFGATNNPWDPNYSPGGSSGGAAAAVAAGMVPMAHAADGGGSIRIPASACGLFGLKPSRGMHPTHVYDDPDGFITHGVVTRSVRDCAQFFDVTKGAQTWGRWKTPDKISSFLSCVETEPRPLKIAFSWHNFSGEPAHPTCQKAVREAALLCSDLGHHVVEDQPELSFEEWKEGFTILWSMCAGYFEERVRDDLKNDKLKALGSLLNNNFLLDFVLWGYGLSQGRRPMERVTRELALRNRSLTPAHHWMAWSKMNKAAYEISTFLEQYDVFLLPVLGEPPWPTGELNHWVGFDETAQKLLNYSGYTPICNTSGIPAMSMPLYWDEQGLPIGVQFMAPYAREDRLFQLAGQLERARPWEHRTPPGFRQGPQASSAA